MEYKQLGDSKLNVSAVTLGTWAMGGDFFGAVDDAESVRAIQAAIDAGINVIDTAPAYGNGHAEEVVGTAIADRRDQVIIATKVGIIRPPDGGFERNLNPKSVQREIDATLRRLQTDYVDLYIIHWPDPATPLDSTLEALRRIHDAGKFRYLGVSNFGPELIDQCRAVLPVVASQPHYSLVQRECEADVLPYCRSNGIGTMGYGSLAGGILTGKFREIPRFPAGDNRARFYDFFREPVWTRIQDMIGTLKDIAADHNATPAQVAINWARRDDYGVTTALVGARTVDQAQSNAAAGTWSLSPSEIERIEGAYRQAFPAD